MKLRKRQTLTPDWDKIGIEKPKSIFITSTVEYERTVTGFHPGKIEYERPVQNFITGSSYEGSWNTLGFSGYGVYVFPHEASYHGYFKDGQFHGKGAITYPVGHKLKGLWRNGKLTDSKFVFSDGLEVNDLFEYCQMPDRRFQIEFNSSLKGPGEEFLTNRQPTVAIPEGCYDTIDGFCDPVVKCIFNYDEEALASNTTPNHKRQTDNLKRTISKDECEFIKDHYRVWSLKILGYRPDLYEYWMTGRASDVKNVLMDMNCENIRTNNASGTIITQESSSESGVNLELHLI